jgi:hypothetical protein
MVNMAALLTSNKSPTPNEWKTERPQNRSERSGEEKNLFTFMAPYIINDKTE